MSMKHDQFRHMVDVSTIYFESQHTMVIQHDMSELKKKKNTF